MHLSRELYEINQYMENVWTVPYFNYHTNSPVLKELFFWTVLDLQKNYDDSTDLRQTLHPVSPIMNVFH